MYPIKLSCWFTTASNGTKLHKIMSFGYHISHKYVSDIVTIPTKTPTQTNIIV